MPKEANERDSSADENADESQARSFATWVAAGTSGAIIAQQVAGKAIRDAFYLSNYPVKTLPTVMVVGALVSLLSVFAVSRLLAKMSPRNVLPWLFVGSGVGFFLAWILALAAPGPAAIVVYIQNAVLSPVLISTFWAHINERYDPYAAKRAVARIGAGGTIGGLLGGLATWRLSSSFSLVSAVLGLAILNALCVIGVLMSRINAPTPARASRSMLPPEPSDAGVIEPLRLLKKAPFLLNLALLVAGGSAISTLLDYVFNAQATAVYGKGASLLAFFSLFGLVVSVGSLLLQVIFGRVAIEKLSVVMNVGILPGIILLGGAFGLTVPGLASATIMRGSELVYRNSLFRSAYELFYTPVSPSMKRRTKTVIDVGFDRFGTMIGGALTALAVLTLHAQPIALAIVLAMAMLTTLVIRNLHRGYVAALEQGLVDGAKKFKTTDPPQRLTVDDERVHAALAHKAESLGLRPRDNGRATIALQNKAIFASAAAALLSGDEARTREALKNWNAEQWPLAPFAIVLLRDKSLFADARAALLTMPKIITGQLIDALIDPEMDLVVRRRIPRILAEAGTQLAANGLLFAITDEKFEVRFACSRALFSLTEAHSDLSVPRERVIEAVLAEAKREPADRSRAEQQRDSDEDLASKTLVDVMLQERVAYNIEHIFMMLALVLDREPLRLCLRALHQEDPRHRGTALEYLQTVLPDEVRDAVWPLIGDAKDPLPAPRPARELLSELAVPIATSTERLDESIRTEKNAQL